MSLKSICAISSSRLSPLIVVYTVEITPTKIRAKVLSLFNLTVSASLVFNQYVNPIALEKIGWRYYWVYVGWLAFELLFIYFYMIETKVSHRGEVTVKLEIED